MKLVHEKMAKQKLAIGKDVVVVSDKGEVTVNDMDVIEALLNSGFAEVPELKDEPKAKAEKFEEAEDKADELTKPEPVVDNPMAGKVEDKKYTKKWKRS